MKKDLYIRADGNEVIGTGHLMRCFVYATEWKRNYGNCYFIAADEVTKRFVVEHGFSCFVLNSAWDNLDNEIRQLKELLSGQSAELLLIDSYYYTSEYVKELKKCVKIAAISDRTKESSLADVIINYNIYADPKEYVGISDSTSLLLGTQYYPLREEFKSHQITIKDKVDRIYLTAGGTDPLNLLYEVGKQLIEKGFTVEAVTGKYNKHLSQLRKLEESSPLFHLYVDISNVAEVMEMCQIAISAGGITLYELCAMAIPTITYAFVDNQLTAVHTMKEKNIMVSVGDIRSNVSGSIIRIIEDVSKLSKDKVIREKMANSMKTLIDGNGAKRVCAKLYNMDNQAE